MQQDITLVHTIDCGEIRVSQLQNTLFRLAMIGFRRPSVNTEMCLPSRRILIIDLLWSKIAESKTYSLHTLLSLQTILRHRWDQPSQSEVLILSRWSNQYSRTAYGLHHVAVAVLHSTYFAVYSKQCIFVINKQFLTMAVFVGQFNPFEMIAAEIVFAE